MDRQTVIHIEEKGHYYVFSEHIEDTAFEADKLFPLDKKYVRGTVYFNGYLFKESNECEGTHLTQISQADIKGSLPKYLVNKLVPTGATDFIGCMIKAIKSE